MMLKNQNFTNGLMVELTPLHPEIVRTFMADTSLSIACKKLKIARIIYSILVVELTFSFER